MALPAIAAVAKTAGKKLATTVGRRVVRRTVQRHARTLRSPRRRRLILLGGAIGLALMPFVLFAMIAATTLALFAPFGDEETAQENCQPESGLTGAFPATGNSFQGAVSDPAQLSQEQVQNAEAIIATGQRLKVPAFGWVVALATAMQESTLRNLDYGDRDSLGLFQQRANWGSTDERLDPVTSATMFYTGGSGGPDRTQEPGLLDISGWETMPVTQAAQAVQISAFPDAYADDEPLARALVQQVGDAQLPGGCGLPPGLECAPAPWPDLENGLTPDALRTLRCLYEKFPQFKTFFGIGDRPAGGDGDHAAGRAVDAMIPFENYRSSGATAYGWKVANWVRNNHTALGVKYIIWDKKIWSVARNSEGWRDYDHYAGCTSDTCLHLDHVHVSVYGDAGRLPDTGDWVLPVPPHTYRLTSRFGDCGQRWESCHTGLDFAANAGTPVRAAAGGQIVYAQPSGGPYGTLVRIDHGNGVETMYAHLQSISPGAQGAEVQPGQTIGYVGTTGNSTGPHLHFEVRVRGTAQDPEFWLSGHGVRP